MRKIANQASRARRRAPVACATAPVVVLLAALIGAGGGVGVLSPQARRAGGSPGVLLEDLERLVDGLAVPSERDAPLVPFALEGYDGRELRAADLLRLTGRDAATPIEVVPLAEFFAAITAGRDWHDGGDRERAARFGRVAEILDEALEGVRVYKVGVIVKDIYILGRAGDGTYMGLRTQVVET